LNLSSSKIGLGLSEFGLSEIGLGLSEFGLFEIGLSIGTRTVRNRT